MEREFAIKNRVEITWDFFEGSHSRLSLEVPA